MLENSELIQKFVLDMDDKLHVEDSTAEPKCPNCGGSIRLYQFVPHYVVGGICRGCGVASILFHGEGVYAYKFETLRGVLSAWFAALEPIQREDTKLLPPPDALDAKIEQMIVEAKDERDISGGRGSEDPGDPGIIEV